MTKQPKPIIHGPDHRPVGFNGPDDPGGADPIPWVAATASANLPWATVKKSMSITSGTTGTSVDMDTSGTATGDTDGSGVLTLGDAGGGTHGILINEAGSYLIFLSAQAQTTGSPAAGSVIGIGHTLDQGDLISGDYYRPWYTVPGSSAKNLDVTLGEWFNADPATYTFPQGCHMSVVQNSGLTVTVFAQLTIIRFSDVSSPNFV